MRKAVAAIARRTGLSPYAARNLAEKRGMVGPRKMPEQFVSPGRGRSKKPTTTGKPALTGRANAMTRGKGKKTGLKRQGY
jgi:hypothetical protein